MITKVIGSPEQEPIFNLKTLQLSEKFIMSCFQASCESHVKEMVTHQDLKFDTK